MIPVGKGMFIWRLAVCAGGDPVRLASMAQEAGFSWVAIKSADGVYDMNQGPGGDWRGPNLLPGCLIVLGSIGGVGGCNGLVIALPPGRLVRRRRACLRLGGRC